MIRSSTKFDKATQNVFCRIKPCVYPLRLKVITKLLILNWFLLSISLIFSTKSGRVEFLQLTLSFFYLELKVCRIFRIRMDFYTRWSSGSPWKMLRIYSDHECFCSVVQPWNELFPNLGFGHRTFYWIYSCLPPLPSLGNCGQSGTDHSMLCSRLAVIRAWQWVRDLEALWYKEHCGRWVTALESCLHGHNAELFTVWSSACNIIRTLPTRIPVVSNDSPRSSPLHIAQKGWFIFRSPPLPTPTDPRSFLVELIAPVPPLIAPFSLRSSRHPLLSRNVLCLLQSPR